MVRQRNGGRVRKCRRLTEHPCSDRPCTDVTGFSFAAASASSRAASSQIELKLHKRIEKCCGEPLLADGFQDYRNGGFLVVPLPTAREDMSPAHGAGCSWF